MTTDSGSVVLVIESMRRDKDRLLVNGKVLGTMSMDMVFTVEEVWHAIRLAFCRGVISFVLLMPYYSIKRLFR